MTEEQLLNLARVLAEHRGWTLSTVATYAAGDGKFFKRVEEGTSPRGNTIRRVADWFDENWGDDLDWPASIPRPSHPKPSSGEAA